MQCFYQYQTVLSTTRQLCGQLQLFQLKLKIQLPTTLISSSLCQLLITKITKAVSITNYNINTKTSGPAVHETELFFEKEVNIFSYSKSALVAVPILNSESLSKIQQHCKRNCTNNWDKHQGQEKNCSYTLNHNLLGLDRSRYHNRNLDLIYLNQPQKYSQLKFQQAEAQVLKVSSSPLLDEEEEYKEKRKIMSLPNVVFVLGGPGAGKGTQCSKIVETFGFVHLSAGDLLREERNKPGSEYGELIEKHIRDGTIVPVEITCSLIARAMENSPKKNFLIDGFPRSQNNLDGWEAEMTGKVNVLFVLFFDAPEDVCVGRCLQRGQAGSGRSDDNPESLKKRVFTYMNDTMPIIEHFKKQDLVRRIDASQDADTVFEEVSAGFKDVV